MSEEEITEITVDESEVEVMDTTLLSSAIDPDTQVEIHFSHEDQLALIEAERDVDYGITKVSLAFKKIRDKKLYLMRGCNSMREYATSIMQMSTRQMQRYLSVADVFGSSPNVGNIPALSMSKLLKAAKNPFLVEKLNSEILSKDELKELIDEATIEMQTKYVKAVTAKKSLHEKNKALSGQVEQLQEEIAGFTHMKPELLKKITDKGMALKEVKVAREEVITVIGRLEKINQVNDPEVISEVRGLIEQIKTYFKELHIVWGEMT